MPKTKVREITIIDSKGAFSIFKKPELSKEDYDFEGIAVLRQLLTNERARVLHIIKEKLNPIARLNSELDFYY